MLHSEADLIIKLRDEDGIAFNAMPPILGYNRKTCADHYAYRKQGGKYLSEALQFLKDNQIDTSKMTKRDIHKLFTDNGFKFKFNQVRYFLFKHNIPTQFSTVLFNSRMAKAKELIDKGYSIDDAMRHSIDVDDVEGHRLFKAKLTDYACGIETN